MPQAASVPANDMPQRLTRRYVLALVLLAVLASGALLVAYRVIAAYEGTATLVNVAGRQRMLSQRAVLFADRLTSPSALERGEARRELLNATADLARANAALSQGRGDPDLPWSMTPALHRLYFGRTDSINPLLEKFLAAAQAVAAASLKGPVAVDNPDLLLINEIGPTRLLSALDKAVGHYEASGEAGVQRLRDLEIAAWLAGLLVLIATGLFIFAPMVRRLAENLSATRAATDALAESEERFALAAKGSSVGIRDHFDLKSDDEYWSPQFYHLLGYEPDELTPSRSAFHLILHPDDRERVGKALDQHLREHTALSVECRLQHRSQTYRWFLMTGQAIWSPAGPARRLITSFMDIDARKQAEEMKSEFVSTVAHELRTPLTSIVGALGLMRSKVVGDLTEKGDRLVAIAQDNCERLVNLINDLLDVEKIESGKIAFDFETESLSHLLSLAEEQNALYAEQKGATIELEPLDHDVKVEVDKARFAQVMSNLLSNAAKYSPPGGKITISADASDRSVRIKIRDRGPGIPTGFRDRIFQRFTQANDSGQKAGTGLGLSIAKAIVEAHRGTIGFDTVEGQGTTFFFDLPVAGISAAPRELNDGASDVVGLPTATFGKTRTARILLVEPRAVARATISLQVGDISELNTVSCCRDAGALLARRAFDLVILDRALLDDAGAMLAQVLAEKGRPLPPILVYTDDAAGEEVWPDGIGSFVRAQVSKETLRQAVLDELLRREKQLAERFRKSA